MLAHKQLYNQGGIMSTWTQYEYKLVIASNGAPRGACLHQLAQYLRTKTV